MALVTVSLTVFFPNAMILTFSSVRDSTFGLARSISFVQALPSVLLRAGRP